jgi:integrase
MAHGLNLLSSAFVTNAKAGFHHDGGGLYLQVTGAKGGGLNKSWVFRYRRAGKLRDMGLGSLQVRGLADARLRAKALRMICHDGRDPIRERREAKAAAALAAVKPMTFDEAARRYITSHDASWRNARHRQQWVNTLEQHASPVLGKLDVRAIETSHVLQVLEPLWKTTTETGSRLRGRIEAVLAWATVKGYRTGDNPARWRGHLKEALPARAKVRKIEHHAALPVAAIPMFMAELRALDTTAAQALEFTILTTGRAGETLGARWEEVDFNAKVWTVPKERMKAHREHLVPLSDAAIAVLERAKADSQSAFVFPGRYGPLSHPSMREVLTKLQRGVTVHGFRSTFRDWAGDHTTFDRETIEWSLAHGIGDAVEAAYRRSTAVEKRRRLMAAWADFAAGKEQADNVVAFQVA